MPFRTITLMLFLALLLPGCSSSKPSPSKSEPVVSTSQSLVSAVKKTPPGRPFGTTPVDLCLILSGQMYGYLQPCGCSRPQLGGLERRHELMRRFAALGYTLSAGDLGDLAPREQAGPQNRWKYEMAVKSLKAMSYSGMALGPTELAMRHDAALDLAQNYQPPVILCANLLDPDGQFPEMFKPFAIDDPRRSEDIAVGIARLAGSVHSPLAAATSMVTGRPRVGYLGLVGDSIIADCASKKYEVKFSPPAEALKATLPAFLARQPEVKVLLFQGTATEAAALLKTVPVGTFNIVLCRNDASDGVAPILAIKDESGASIIMVGHKGRAVGVVAYRRGKPIEYRLEELVEDLELPDNQTNPSREIMKEYVWGVYSNKFIEQVPKISHPVQLDPEMKDAVFVGASKCKECHPQAHGHWSASQHSHAWENLVKAGRPIAEVPQKGGSPKLIGRQFDPDCAKCHVTGFGYKGGYEDDVKSVHLFGNGCENCHGPGSLHAGQPTNPTYRKPMKLSIDETKRTGEMCMRCHDLDNDPHFDIAKWEKIKHGREK
jgi:hypothetical protein